MVETGSDHDNGSETHDASFVWACVSEKLPSSGHGHHSPNDTLTSLEDRPLPVPGLRSCNEGKPAIIAHLRSPREWTWLLIDNGA